MAYFYSHLIKIQTINSKMDELDLAEDQKKHLAELIDSIIHQEILDLILSKLPEDEKVIFLTMVRNDLQNEETMEFLNERIDKIDQQIEGVADKLIKELHEDMEEAKKNG